MRDQEKITYFAETDARNRRVRFGIKARDRTRHVYVIGKTGMGKSTLLENMAIQDLRNGEGMAFIDPHGKTADLFLDYVPADRLKDVLYFAPFDTQYPVAFNVMEDVGPEKRHLVSNGLMSAFKKIWVDAWSARMEYILNNTLLALLEYPGSTLLGVNRMLADKEYRKKVVENITDVSVKSFWVDEFAKYGDRYMQEAGAAIQNKVGQFISNPLVRNIIGQSRSTFDIRKFMDERKIIIVNLSKGLVGEQNANLLGSMLVTKIYLAAMSRADTPDSSAARLPNFYLYVDEFQSFANESFADILSEARKYKLNLTIAHQYIEQMSEEVRAAVFGNVGTMISFRVGAFDAEILEKEFAPQFTAEDMVNLGFAQIYLKLMIDGVSSPPFSAVTLAPFEKPATSIREQLIEYTRQTFAIPKKAVEAAIRDWSLPIAPPASQNRELRDSKKSYPPRQNIPNQSIPVASIGVNTQKAAPGRDKPQTTYRPKYNPSYGKNGKPRPTDANPRNENETPRRDFDNKARPIITKIPDEPAERMKLSELSTGGSKDNRNQLRDALASVLADMKKTTEVKLTTSQENRNGTIPTEKSGATNTATPQNTAPIKNPEAQKPEQTQPSPPKEIPENILREVLRGEEEEKER
ncbi:MAG: hypothetical protein A3G59_00790 [Candidatus Taylorbacteria bacterium RIFCSPLOWO2_12_FULL_47_20]|uniref:Type IV secretion system coupling protein TraD DNA-binding domain-containing protein n=1 Tax=Candidatus Taylorbacteria bacterium RIFCSPLOWO2_12_FULL_47_20 TaxID=1802335 RepID=A0A1G2P6V3_9BACT|nr:MAG: hypothetical protein A3G59_00790 [Candidatus Taylorbacteria bacterium RIFCSPLOWO2_12_FULL_47_20]